VQLSVAYSVEEVTTKTRSERSKHRFRSVMSMFRWFTDQRTGAVDYVANGRTAEVLNPSTTSVEPQAVASY
jgi:hypothetical protein